MVGRARGGATIVPSGPMQPPGRPIRPVPLDMWRRWVVVTLPRERAVDGRFGPYGGRYVPETLVSALDELTALYDEARGDAAFWAEFEGLLRDFVGRPTPLSEAPRHQRHDRGPRASEARGPEPHRRAQDQQHHRPGAAGPAHGQAAHHRRDRGGAARRGHGDGLRPLRAGVRGVHGRRGRRAPGAQRLPDAAAGGHGGARSTPAPARSRTPPTRRSATG